MPSALFEIDPGTGTFGAPGAAQDCASGATIRCRLASTEGVTKIEWSTTGTSAPSVADLSFTLSGTPLGQIATATLPAGIGKAFGITCKVNDGAEVTGEADHTKRSAVYVLFGNGQRPCFIRETNEGNATHNKVPELNYAIENTGGGGGSVASVFGRTGAVVAQDNDYTSSQVDNTSTVTGDTVTDALNTIDTQLGSIAVTSVFARTGAVVAAGGDYNSGQVTNTSGVSGATVSDALDALAAGGGSAGAHVFLWGPNSSNPAAYATLKAATDAALATNVDAIVRADVDGSTGVADFETSFGTTTPIDALGRLTLDLSHLPSEWLNTAVDFEVPSGFDFKNFRAALGPVGRPLYIQSSGTGASGAFFHQTIKGLPLSLRNFAIETGTRSKLVLFNVTGGTSELTQLEIDATEDVLLYSGNIESNGSLAITLRGGTKLTSGGVVSTGGHGGSLTVTAPFPEAAGSNYGSGWTGNKTFRLAAQADPRQWHFSSATGGGDPGAGWFALNGSWTAATTLYISDTNKIGAAIGDLMRLPGELLLTIRTEPGGAVRRARISNPVDQGTYTSWDFSYLSGTTPSNLVSYVLEFTPRPSEAPLLDEYEVLTSPGSQPLGDPKTVVLWALGGASLPADTGSETFRALPGGVLATNEVMWFEVEWYLVPSAPDAYATAPRFGRGVVSAMNLAGDLWFGDLGVGQVGSISITPTRSEWGELATEPVSANKYSSGAVRGISFSATMANGWTCSVIVTPLGRAIHGQQAVRFTRATPWTFTA